MRFAELLNRQEVRTAKLQTVINDLARETPAIKIVALTSKQSDHVSDSNLCRTRSGWAEERRDPDCGSPFFSLGFFGETKKGRSPAAATERQRNSAERTLLESTQASTSSARTGFGIGRFRGQSTNSPSSQLALRVLRSEIVIRPPKPERQKPHPSR